TGKRRGAVTSQRRDRSWVRTSDSLARAHEGEAEPHAYEPEDEHGRQPHDEVHRKSSDHPCAAHRFSTTGSTLFRIAAGPCSPVRIRMTSSTATIVTLPSPTRPVRAASTIAYAVGIASSSQTTISSFTFG